MGCGVERRCAAVGFSSRRKAPLELEKASGVGEYAKWGWFVFVLYTHVQQQSRRTSVDTARSRFRSRCSCGSKSCHNGPPPPNAVGGRKRYIPCVVVVLLHTYRIPAPYLLLVCSLRSNTANKRPPVFVFLSPPPPPLLLPRPCLLHESRQRNDEPHGFYQRRGEVVSHLHQEVVQAGRYRHRVGTLGGTRRRRSHDRRGTPPVFRLLRVSQLLLRYRVSGDRETQLFLWGVGCSPGLLLLFLLCVGGCAWWWCCCWLPCLSANRAVFVFAAKWFWSGVES